MCFNTFRYLYTDRVKCVCYIKCLINSRETLSSVWEADFRWIRSGSNIKSSFLKTETETVVCSREISRVRVLKGARESRERPSLEYF